MPNATKTHTVPALAGASGSLLFRLDDGDDGLEYIARSPAQEHGGFHPHLVATAKGALAEIKRLREALEDIVRGDYAPGADRAHPAVALAKRTLANESR